MTPSSNQNEENEIGQFPVCLDISKVPSRIIPFLLFSISYIKVIWFAASATGIKPGDSGCGGQKQALLSPVHCLQPMAQVGEWAQRGVLWYLKCSLSVKGKQWKSSSAIWTTAFCSCSFPLAKAQMDEAFIYVSFSFLQHRIKSIQIWITNFVVSKAPNKLCPSPSSTLTASAGSLFCVKVPGYWFWYERRQIASGEAQSWVTVLAITAVLPGLL